MRKTIYTDWYSRFIWLWEVKRYRASGCHIVRDSSCGILRRRADVLWDLRQGHPEAGWHKRNKILEELDALLEKTRRN